MKKKSYTYSELVDYLKFNDEETNLYMPNEIFDDLKSLNIKPTPHLAFTYTYYYFITWLYRYTKFEHTKILTRNIKEVLGYKPDYEKIDYIIKKNGLLDNASYTETTTNYPAYWEFDEWENLKFVLLSELDAEVKSLGECLGANYKVKIPVKHVHRSVESNEDGYEDGVFYDVSNTHHIPFEVFLFSMTNQDIGCTGFYLYGYLKCKNQLFSNGYDVSLPKLAAETGIKPRTLDNYLDALRRHRMIKGIVNQEFIIDFEGEGKANTYITNKFTSFSDIEITYEKRKVTNMAAIQLKKEKELELEQQVEDALDNLDELFA